jgi:hypothetical protein
MKEYGERLVCVRYRYDIKACKRIKTAEIIVDERAWTPPADTMVLIQIKWGELERARSVRAAGGEWLPTQKLWRLRFAAVAQLGLIDRIIEADERSARQRKRSAPNDSSTEH